MGAGSVNGLMDIINGKEPVMETAVDAIVVTRETYKEVMGKRYPQQLPGIQQHRRDRLAGRPLLLSLLCCLAHYPVSYTQLYVYKRQIQCLWPF